MSLVPQRLSARLPVQPLDPGMQEHPTKHKTNVFQFIEIHQASGRPDAAEGAKMRSYIKRSEHDARRRREKQCSHTKVAFRSGEYMDTASSEKDIVASQRFVGIPRLPTPPPTPLSSERSLSPRKILVLCSDSKGSRPGPPFFRQEIVCFECGELVLPFLPNEEQRRDGFYGSSQALSSYRSYYPFDCAAIGINHRMHELIHYFIFHFGVPTNPPIYNKDGLPHLMDLLQVTLSLSDAASVRAIVALAASHRATKESSTKPSLGEAYYHNMEGVRLLNKKFDDPEEALSTTALFAATILGMGGAYLGDNAAIEAHYKGIIKLVKLRGGIDTLPKSLAALIITRTIVYMAWKHKTKAPFPMYRSRFREHLMSTSAIDICNKPESELFPKNQHHPSPELPLSPFPNTLFKRFLCSDLFIIACDLLGLSYTLDLHMRSPLKIGRLQREYFEDTFAAAQHGQVAFPYPHDPNVVKSVSYYRQHCWRTASIVYVNTALRTMYPGTHYMKELTTEIITALHNSDQAVMWYAYPEVLVWILFVGACGAYDPVGRGWFLIELRHGMMLLGIGRKEELEVLLRGLLFTECMQRPYLDRIWRELHPGDGDA